MGKSPEKAARRCRGQIAHVCRFQGKVSSVGHFFNMDQVKTETFAAADMRSTRVIQYDCDDDRRAVRRVAPDGLEEITVYTPFGDVDGEKGKG